MKLVLASSNAGKLAEFRSLLDPLKIDLVRQADLGVSDPPETGLSFVENALLKARHASLSTGLPSLADDSGIIVDALNGEPGIYSARYAGLPSNSAANIAKLLRAMKDVPKSARTARFCCVLVYLRYPQDPLPIICQGLWEGRIIEEGRGSEGFGYDPIFYLPSHDCTAAELPKEIKNQISHRAQALKEMLLELNKGSGKRIE